MHRIIILSTFAEAENRCMCLYSRCVAFRQFWLTVRSLSIAVRIFMDEQGTVPKNCTISHTKVAGQNLPDKEANCCTCLFKMRLSYHRLLTGILVWLLSASFKTRRSKNLDRVQQADRPLAHSVSKLLPAPLFKMPFSHRLSASLPPEKAAPSHVRGRTGG